MKLMNELDAMKSALTKAEKGFTEGTMTSLLSFFGTKWTEDRFLTKQVSVQEAVDKMGPILEAILPSKWKIHRESNTSYWFESDYRTGEVSFVLGYGDSPLFLGKLRLGSRKIDLVDLEAAILKDKENLGRPGMEFVQGDLETHQNALAARDVLLSILWPYDFTLGTIE